MRSKHKSWQNARKLPHWTARIIWYQNDDEPNLDIRLHLEDCYVVESLHPKDKEVADRIWEMFKDTAPPKDVRTPFVAELVQRINSHHSTECIKPHRTPGGAAKPKQPCTR